MEDVYQDDVQYEPEPKKMSGWLIALIVIVVLIFVCCIGCFVATVLLGMLDPAIGDVFSTIVETLEAATPLP